MPKNKTKEKKRIKPLDPNFTFSKVRDGENERTGQNCDDNFEVSGVQLELGSSQLQNEAEDRDRECKVQSWRKTSKAKIGGELGLTDQQEGEDVEDSDFFQNQGIECTNALAADSLSVSSSSVEVASKKSNQFNFGHKVFDEMPGKILSVLQTKKGRGRIDSPGKHLNRLELGKNGIRRTKSEAGMDTSVSVTLGSEDTSSEKDCMKDNTAGEHLRAAKNQSQIEAGPKKKLFNELFKNNRNEGFTLKPVEVEEGFVIDPNEERNVEKDWGFCLVGYFAGKFPGKKGLLDLCNSWKVKYEYIPHASGWLIFRFDSEEDRAMVLNRGPFFVFGSPLMLKVMPNNFEFGNEEISFMPVWVQLPQLPLNCWTPSILQKIGSRIGKPIATDKLTSTMERVSFARILVEVDAAKEQPKSVSFVLSNGKQRIQEIVYEQDPKFCINCSMFGHVLANCKHLQTVKEPCPHQDKETCQNSGDPKGGNGEDVAVIRQDASRVVEGKWQQVTKRRISPQSAVLKVDQRNEDHSGCNELQEADSHETEPGATDEVQKGSLDEDGLKTNEAEMRTELVKESEDDPLTLGKISKAKKSKNKKKGVSSLKH